MAQQPNGRYPDRRNQPARQKIPRWAYAAAAAALILITVYGGAQLLAKRQDTARTEQINQENLSLLGTQTPAPSPTAAPAAAQVETPQPASSETAPTAQPARIVKGSASPRPPVQGKFDDLLARNSDLVGWLTVDAVYRINFAVVQSDNDFYMTHDFTRAENREGTAFLDETNVLWPRDDHLIIYAHNMKSGSMFGELNKLSDESILRRNPFVSFNTLYENGDYIPFAVINCDVSDPSSENYFNFYVRNFRTTDVFERFLQRARTLSVLDLSQVDVRPDDALLTLSTCYDDANKTRFLVMLRRLRPDETRQSVQEKYFTDPSM